ncbi:hypothetical protein GCM10011613_20770 [Cellvibrio zantedeschiae]|uniref:DUF4097 domain-containing protein n=2 Tax=Cellvibrio zantedeschiae TaxID=1237077 RepID=A0ABQ3B1X3_9GAMM|nr:hypothetical protein GCM10011613_20770 [Cellvibrio zantedeschiae]
MAFDHADIQISEQQADGIKIRFSQKLIWGSKENCLHTLESDSSGASTLKIYNQSNQSDWNLLSSCKVNRSIQVILNLKSLEGLKVKVDHGNVDLGDVKTKSFYLTIDHGDLVSKKIIGQKISLQYDHGDFRSNELNAPLIKINGDHGDLAVDEITSENLTIDGSHGNLIINKAKVATADLNQAHVDSTFNEWHGKTLSSRDDHGNLNFNRVSLESVSLVNDHGDVLLNGSVRQVLVKDAHGDINVSLTNSEFSLIEAKNDHGKISLRIPAKSVCELKLSDEQTLSGNLLKSNGECARNANTQVVKLHSSKGNVSVIGF